MASLLRFLGLGGSSSGSGSAVASGGPGGETETVRRIAARLERLEPERARFLAAFAYVLARVAQADLHITETESEEMLEIVRQVAQLSAEEAALVVEIAKSQARLLGGTENYVVTREFRRIATREERLRLIDCLYRVGAADGTISTTESAEIAAVASELGLTRAELAAVRSGHRDKLAELQGLRRDS